MSLGPMKPIYLVRGWYWRRYWSQWATSLIAIAVVVICIFLMIALITGNFETRRHRDHRLIQEQAILIQELQHRVDSLSLRLDEVAPRNGILDD